MNLADGLWPELNVQDFSEGSPAGSTAPVASAMRPGGPPLSPQWLNALGSMEELRQSLDRHKVMETYPDVAHDFMAVLASLDAMRGDTLFEAFWRAQMARIANQHPNMKSPPEPTMMRLGGGSVYAAQPVTRLPSAANLTRTGE